MKVTPGPTTVNNNKIPLNSLPFHNWDEPASCLNAVVVTATMLMYDDSNGRLNGFYISHLHLNIIS